MKTYPQNPRLGVLRIQGTPVLVLTPLVIALFFVVRGVLIPRQGARRSF